MCREKCNKCSQYCRKVLALITELSDEYHEFTLNPGGVIIIISSSRTNTSNGFPNKRKLAAMYGRSWMTEFVDNVFFLVSHI